MGFQATARRRARRMMKVTIVQMIRPGLMATRSMAAFYLRITIMKQRISAIRVAPSIMAAVMIIFVPIAPLACG